MLFWGLPCICLFFIATYQSFCNYYHLHRYCEAVDNKYCRLRVFLVHQNEDLTPFGLPCSQESSATRNFVACTCCLGICLCATVSLIMGFLGQISFFKLLGTKYLKYMVYFKLEYCLPILFP